MVPDAAAGAIAHRYAELQRQFPIRKKQIPSRRLHLSLLGVCVADHLPARIVQTSLTVGAAIRFVEYDVSLTRALSYRNRRVERPCVLTADVASSLRTNRLASQIRHVFSRITGCQPYRSGPINPHVTLAWDRFSLPEQCIEPIALPVREFALVHSFIGRSQYEILGRWHLVSRE